MSLSDEVSVDKRWFYSGSEHWELSLPATERGLGDSRNCQESARTKQWLFEKTVLNLTRICLILQQQQKNKANIAYPELSIHSWNAQKQPTSCRSKSNEKSAAALFWRFVYLDLFSRLTHTRPSPLASIFLSVGTCAKKFQIFQFQTISKGNNNNTIWCPHGQLAECSIRMSCFWTEDSGLFQTQTYWKELETNL